MEAEEEFKKKKGPMVRRGTTYGGEEGGGEEDVEGTDADQRMSSCSFWSVGSPLPASIRNGAGAALPVRAPGRQHEQHMAVQTRRGAGRDRFSSHFLIDHKLRV